MLVEQEYIGFKEVVHPDVDRSVNENENWFVD